MNINLSLNKLLEEAFGVGSGAFDPEFSKLPERKEKGVYGAQYYAKGANGVEQFLPVWVIVSKEVAESVGIKNSLGIWQLPNAVISIRNSAYIIDTVLTERRGFVSEYINTAGWKISVRGLMIGKNEFPEADFQILTKLFTKGRTMRMRNALTDLVLLDKERNGSDDVVLRDIDLPGVPGVPNVRAYSLEFTANEPFNLEDIS